MTITACVKNKRTSSLPQNPSLVALLFKDEGGFSQPSSELSSSGRLVGDKVKENEGKKNRRES